MNLANVIVGRIVFISLLERKTFARSFLPRCARNLAYSWRVRGTRHNTTSVQRLCLVGIGANQVKRVFRQWRKVHAGLFKEFAGTHEGKRVQAERVGVSAVKLVVTA